MESTHKKSGKVFTGKFAETAVRIGIATPKGEVKKSAVKPKPKTKGKRAKK